MVLRLRRLPRKSPVVYPVDNKTYLLYAYHETRMSDDTSIAIIMECVPQLLSTDPRAVFAAVIVIADDVVRENAFG